MADRQKRLPFNASGKYYVDGNCITHCVCCAVACENFKILRGHYSYVVRQPQTPEEEALVNEAIKMCPIEVIGDDGDEGSELMPWDEVWAITDDPELKAIWEKDPKKFQAKLAAGEEILPRPISSEHAASTACGTSPLRRVRNLILRAMRFR